MLVAAVSDLHGELPEIPKCDLLLIAGDICPVWQSHAIETQWDYIEGPFNDWLWKVPAQHIVGIAGNHDFIAEAYPDVMRNLESWVYLQDEETTAYWGLKIYGTPWTPKFFNWAFMKEEEDLKPHWDAIPDDTDILITHGPPRTILDKNREGKNVGSWTLLDKVDNLGPLKLHVFGHIHEGYGMVGEFGFSPVWANVALLDRDYENTNPIQVFEL